MLVESNPKSGQITVGADKGYDAKEFVEQCRMYGITPVRRAKYEPQISSG